MQQLGTCSHNLLRKLLQTSGTKTRNRAWKTAGALACMATFVFPSLLRADTDSAFGPTIGRGLGFAYDPAREIAIAGTVKAFLSQVALGSPIGLRLLVLTAGKVVDAYLGPFVSKEIREALHPGQSVQIIGMNEQIHGKNVLLARQLVLDGRLVRIRNERGFLGRNGVFHHKVRDGQSAVDRGIQ